MEYKHVSLIYRIFCNKRPGGVTFFKIGAFIKVKFSVKKLPIWYYNELPMNDLRVEI